MKKWYCIGTGEIDSYEVEGSLTDFCRGTFLAYGDCCLTTGFDTKEEAEKWLKEHPCLKHRKEGMETNGNIYA